MSPERYIAPEILQLVLHISRATSYRVARELGPARLGGRLKGVRVPLSAVRAKLGEAMADAVEHEANHQLLKQRSMGLGDDTPLTDERRAVVEQLAAAWRRVRRARGFGGRVETPGTSDPVVAGREEDNP